MPTDPPSPSPPSPSPSPPPSPPPPPPFFLRRPSRPQAFAAFLLLCTTFALYLRYSAHNDTQALQTPYSVFPCSADDPVRRVAVIGAGSGGSSAAYYLNQYTQPCPNIRLTVYERNPYIGGRSTTVSAYDDPSEPVELGASIFVKVNHNLMHMVKTFGLVTQAGFGAKQSETDERLPDTLGVYDGQHWRYLSPWDPTGGWWTTLQLLWKYGTAPVRTRNLMKDTVGKFLKMYEAPVFPFKDLTRAVFEVGLTSVVGEKGERYLSQNDIAEEFSEDIIQASTRVNYAQNLDTIHGVETMVCMATDGAMSVQGGNWQIFAKMLEDSGARMILNTSVHEIRREEDLTYTISANNPLNEPLEASTYDTVIIAAPYQFSNITIQPHVSSSAPRAIEYITLHVTLFTSPYRLNPQAFNLPPESTVPKTVLTTTGEQGKSSTPYYSISSLRAITNPKTGAREYLYKIFSPNPLSKEWLHSILSPPLPRLHRELRDLEEHDCDTSPITWSHEKIWHSYPVERPRTEFEMIRLDYEENDRRGGGIWYTSSMEAFISTMETSSLMGKNVARLIVDDWTEDLGKGN